MAPKPPKTPIEEADEDMKSLKLFLWLCLGMMILAPLIVIVGAPWIFGPTRTEQMIATDRLPVQEHVFELLAYDPPKHVYVDLKDTVDGRIFLRVYVSKHCNEHRETMKTGNLYRLRFSDPQPGSKQTERIFEDLYPAICKGSQRIQETHHVP